MGSYALIGGTVITPYMEIEDGVVVVSDSKIEAVGRRESISVPEGMDKIDVSSMTLLPGFIDLHIHGALGVKACHGVDAIRTMNEYLPSCGTTGWLPTVDSIEAMEYIVSAIEEDMAGADILGIHMEGPFLAPKNIPGTPYEEPHLPSLKEYETMLEAGKGHFRLMGLAPELDGALELIREMGKTGVVAAAAHSKATYEQVMEAVDAGLRHVTHTYNVMTGLHHRKPGVVGAALTCDVLTCELIGDGYHVSPPAMDILIRCKGAERIALITDNTIYAGCPDGVYGDMEKKGGVVRRRGFTEETDGTMYGSVWPFDHNFRIVKNINHKSMREMALMSSTVPARVAGVIDRKGTLEPGKDADITVLDSNCSVNMCIVGGQIAYEDGK